jgi:hypothetical protein
MSVELECAGMKGGLESGDKLAAEDTEAIQTPSLYVGSHAPVALAEPSPFVANH